MQRRPKAVAITGAAGYIGSRLLLQLESNLNIGKLVAFDRNPLPYPIHNISYYQRDLAPLDVKVAKDAGDSEEGEEQDSFQSRQQKKNTSMSDILRQHRVETLVHLVSVFSHTSTYQDWELETRQDLAIMDYVLESCVEAGLKHVIYLSSHTVYGAFPDNPIPLTEASAVGTRPGDSLGQASFNADESMLEFLEDHREGGEKRPIKVTILRTCPVLGYSDDHQRVERIFPYRFWGAGDNPPFQFIHEVDLAELLEKVIEQEAEGVFNVAGEGVVFLRELADITNRKLTQLPPLLAYPADWLASKRKHPITGNWNLHLTRYPIIMSTGKIKQTLNFRFEYTSMEALNAFVNYNMLL